MSNQESTSDSRVVISPEDCFAALDFWKHFKIEVQPELQAAIDNFAKTPSFENQEKLKLELVRTISSSDHQAFKDEMLSKIVEECKNVAYDMTFDKQLEETLTEE